MIDPKTLQEEDKGKWVFYNLNKGGEKGRIKSWTDQFVFVVFHCENHWSKYEDYTAQACLPKLLTFYQEVVAKIDPSKYLRTPEEKQCMTCGYKFVGYPPCPKCGATMVKRVTQPPTVEELRAAGEIEEE